ncbi:MAG: DUF4145 domain-containing protein [Thermoleophilaceae bacterium]
MTATGDAPQRPSRPPSNFAFLAAGWPDLAAEAVKAERNVVADPRAACFYARRSLELTVHWLYDADRALRRPYKDDLSAMLFEPTFTNAVDRKVRTKMDVIRKQGNAAVHRRKPIEANEAAAVVRELFHVVYWLARTYALKEAHAPAADLRFDPDAIPRPLTAEQRQATREALRRKAEEQATARRGGRAAARPERGAAGRDRAPAQGGGGGQGRQRGAPRRPRLRRAAHARPVHRPVAQRGRLAARRRTRPRVRGHRHAQREGRRLRGLRAVGRRRQAARPGGGQAHPARRPRGPPAGQALRRLPRAGVRPAAGDLLLQRLRDVAVGRRRARLSAARRCRASTPRTSWRCWCSGAARASAWPTPRSTRRSWSATTSTGRSAGSRRPSIRTASAPPWWSWPPARARPAP